MIQKTRKWALISLFGSMALIIAVVGIWLFTGTSAAQAAEITADDLKTITQSSTGPGLLQDGYLAHGGGGNGGFGGKLKGIDYKQLLADALGITVEKLETAYETARTAAIEQAVTEGLITREQADEMLVWGGKGLGLRGLGRGHKGVSDSTIDENALLANALGITVDELQAAREKANLAAIEQAVKEGIITQEQADEMLARKNLKSYIDRDTLLAKALGMTAEELKAAYAEGKTLTTLMSEKGLDAKTVREKLIAAYNDALAQAVKDGVITQEQADEMKDGHGWGMPFGGPGMKPDGRGGPGGPGDRTSPDSEDSSDDTTSGTNWSRPGHAIRGGNTL